MEKIIFIAIIFTSIVLLVFRIKKMFKQEDYCCGCMNAKQCKGGQNVHD